MSQTQIEASLPSHAWAGSWRILRRLCAPHLKLRVKLRAEVAGAALGAILLGYVFWTLENRAVEVMLREMTARATDQATLVVLHHVDPADLHPPFDQAKLARLEASLAPLLELTRQPGSRIVRINLYARDGTFLFGDRLTRRGERITPDDGPLLVKALEGKVVAERTTLNAAENEDLQPLVGEALEVYVPLVQEGEVLGAYELYGDLGPLPRLQPFLLILAVTIGMLCGMSVLRLCRAVAGARVRWPFAQQSATPGETLLVCEAEAGPVPGAPVLTRRERQVLCLLASTHSYREIAETLVVSDETVRTHVKNILRKLHQPDRTQAVVAAMRLGLLRLP